MQYAKSLRFAGMLLNAQECDYKDFINHGLRCPNCGGTVFLVAGSERQVHSRKLKTGESVSVKASVLPAHFSHHSTDRSQIADCELRSARMTSVQRQAFQSQARGQVARIFRQKFFAMLKTSIKLQDCDSINTILLDYWQRASLRQPIAAKAQLFTLVDMLCRQFKSSGQLKHSKEGLERAIERWGNQIIEKPGSIPFPYREQFKSWSNVLDRQMQTLIVSEALDYLCHKAQSDVLRHMVECAVYNWIMARSTMSALVLKKGHISKDELAVIYDALMPHSQHPNLSASELSNAMVNSTRSLIGLDCEEFEALFAFVRDDVVQMLTFVSWADEFEKREST